MIRFVAAMFWRESRLSWKRLLFFVVCIALGVGGLVAVKSFGYGIEQRMEAQARTLMAADLVLKSNRPFTGEERAVLEDLRGRGAEVTMSREFVSMARDPASGQTKLADVRAVGPAYPFYGRVVTGSGHPFRELLSDGTVLAHPSLLLHLGLEVGERLQLGQATFRIAGELLREPDAIELFSMAPRVLLTAGGAEATGLLGRDSLVRHRAMVKLPPGSSPYRVAEEVKAALPDRFARVRTYDEANPRTSRFLGHLTRYLNLVGLVALLLGGVGIAAAIRVFLEQKVETIAVLKCLGATSGIVLAVYLLQAVGLGLLGSGAGIALGFALQGVLPGLLADLLPVEMDFALSWRAAAEGLLLGTATTLLFTLPPILKVRHVPPARVLRRHVEAAAGAGPGRRFEWAWVLAVVLPAVLGLSVWQGGSWEAGGVFYLGLLGALAALFAAARGLLWGLRRLPKPPRFVLKQGLSGLYRPGNQSVPVTIALGLGVLLVLVVYLMQSSLLRQIAVSGGEARPNLAFIDIQPPQRQRFEAVVERRGHRPEQLIPIVRGRIRALNGERIRRDEIADEEKRRVLGFTYAFTYREALAEGESLVAGTFGAEPAGGGHAVSIAQWWHEVTGVGLGDRVTVDIQGVPVSATVTSIRHIDWRSRRANFSLVFQPAALAGAPHMFVATLRVAEEAERVAVQRAVVAELPNVTAIDLSLILRTVQDILDRIALVIQFMAAFSVGVGLIILVGAIATTKYQRLREAVLLKTLGATRAAVAAVLSTEYALLGALAGAVGALAAGGVAWGVLRFVFEARWDWHWPPYVAAAAIAMAVTTAVGLGSSLDILARKPLQVLREE